MKVTKFNNDGFVYISSPYTHHEPAIRELRFLQVCAATAWVINHLRLNALAAIVHSHQLVSRHNLPVEWEFWAAYDTAFIAAATELWVLCIPGYSTSVGILAEIEVAKNLGKRIRYLVPSERNQPYIVQDNDPAMYASH